MQQGMKYMCAALETYQALQISAGASAQAAQGLKPATLSLKWTKLRI